MGRVRRASVRNMNESLAPELKLKVADFGPIRKAAVDLRSLTVFVGPPASGVSLPWRQSDRRRRAP